MATVFSVLIAVPLGVVAALKQNTWIDYIVRIISIAGVAVPSFWLGILIILGLLIASQNIFGEPWLPPIEYVSPLDDFGRNISQLVWPALATGYRYSAVVARIHVRHYSMFCEKITCEPPTRKACLPEGSSVAMHLGMRFCLSSLLSGWSFRSLLEVL